MASPQPTPFVRFSKELFEVFYKDPPDTVAACRVWLWVFRWTWANHGAEEIEGRSVRDIAEEIQLCRSATHRAIQSLLRCRRLKLGRHGGLAIQKDYDLWKHEASEPARSGQMRLNICVPKGGTKSAGECPAPGDRGVPHRGQIRPAPGDSTVPPLGTVIRSKNIIENREQQIRMSEAASGLCKKLAEKMRANNPKVKVPDSLDAWGKEADRMLTRDKRTVQEVERVIDFSQADPFWRCNILSMPKIREKFDQLYMKMEATKNGTRAGEGRIVGAAAPVPGKYDYLG